MQQYRLQTVGRCSGQILKVATKGAVIRFNNSFNSRLPSTNESSLSSSFASFSTSRPDPFARRPTSKCDPYGQSGKPLAWNQVLALKPTVEAEWKVVMNQDDNDNDQTVANNNDDENFIPFAIQKVYWHDDYMKGAQFGTHVAAVAQMNAQHFPHQLVLSRRLDSKTKTWKICTTVVCRTHVLQGLSHHDFYLATLIDIEAERPEVKGLLAAASSEE